MGNSVAFVRARPAGRGKYMGFELSETLESAHGHFSTDALLTKTFVDFVKESNIWMPKIMDNGTTMNSMNYMLPLGGSIDIQGTTSIYALKRATTQAKGLASLGVHADDIDLLMLAVAMPIFFDRYPQSQRLSSQPHHALSASSPGKSAAIPKHLLCTSERTSSTSSDLSETLSRENSRDISSSTLSVVVRHTVSNLQPDKAAVMICRKSWTSSLSNYLNDLKLSITIASATATGNHGERFPLVFVNKAFEAMTGYDRSEILGRGCGFLQSSEHTEQSQVTRLRAALNEMTPVKIGLTNVRKNGSAFFNLLALAPIVDWKGDVIYILGMQYELEGREEQYPQDLQAIDHLMHLLPQLWK